MPLSLKSSSGGNISLDAAATASDVTVNIPATTGLAVVSDAATGAALLPAGTTAQRPSAPSYGTTRFNSTLAYFEVYNGQEWVEITDDLTPMLLASRSLRFRASATAYLNRTMATPTNGKIWTWSGWHKRAFLGGTYSPIFAAGTSGSAYSALWFNNDTLTLYSYNGATAYHLNTNQVFRDPSAWYHIVISVDTTQATASNRIKIYVNGVQITAFGTATYPTQNYVDYIDSAIPHYFGQFTPALGSYYLDGYLAEVNFIDGQALLPTAFGKYNKQSGVWQPKIYTGLYGTNGFYLNFSDNSSTTALGSNKAFTDYEANAVTDVFSNVTKTDNGDGTWRWVFGNVTSIMRLSGLVSTNTSITVNARVKLVSGTVPVFPTDYGDGVSQDLSSALVTGQWVTITRTYTIGVNGGFLDFPSNVNLNGVTLDVDYISISGQNNWTTNNISITAGATYDSMLDVPTLTSAATSNFAVLNPLAKTANGTLSNGNLTYSGADIAPATIYATTGKFYFEAVFSGAVDTTGAGLGVVAGNRSLPLSGYPGAIANLWYAYSGNTSSISFINETTSTAVNAAAIIVSGSQLKVCIDIDAGKIWYGKDTVWFDSTGGSTGNPATGVNPTFTISSPSTRGGFTFFVYCYAAGATIQANFGQRPFTYTPPTGFVALNTYNLPDGTIKQGNKYMDTTLYTGNASARAIGNSGLFQPDLVWIKNRSQAYAHRIFDSIRGPNNRLFTNTTDAEASSAGSLTSFNATGFSLGVDTVGPAGYGVNENTSSFVAWQWQAGKGITSTNTDGTIASTVSVNTTAGFSIVTYTSTGVNATVGHGLGVAPAMIMYKSRNNVGDWVVGHQSMTWNNVMFLDLTNTSAATANAFNNTAPSSSVFSIGSAYNPNGYTQVAYCWAEIAGYSKFGGYTGNGSADGTFVYTGFRPKFIMIKRVSDVSNWRILDTIRDTYNIVSAELYPNTSAAETSYASLDVLSNGFKIRNTDPAYNASGGTYIYMAFAENPFKNSLAR